MPITIVIADDHGLVRAGLRNLLNAEAGFHVIGEAADGDSALGLAGKLQPDILLADLSMPGADGIEIARALRAQASATRVMLVTMHEDDGLVREASAAGARGYISKRAAEAELIRAVRVVASGGEWLPCQALAPTRSAGSQREVPHFSPAGSGAGPSLPSRAQISLDQKVDAVAPWRGTRDCSESAGGTSQARSDAVQSQSPAGTPFNVDLQRDARPLTEDGRDRPSLGEDELALLRLVAEALPDEQIAGALGTVVANVATARQALADKLGCKGRVALIHYARDHALA